MADGRAKNGGARVGGGRKSILKEGRIADLIETSIEITERFLKDETIPIERRSEIASRIAAKRIPSDINLGGQKDNPVGLLVEQLHQKAKEYDAITTGSKNAS